MTDTALIERAKQTVKIIERNYDRHVDLFSIDMQEFGVIHEMLEALEQSQWVSVSDNMPAIGEIVQVAGGRAYLDVNAAWWTVEESPPRKIQWNVTHWKPITPPTQESET